MAKKKKQETVEKAKYDPRTKLGSYIQNSGGTMTSVPQKGYWENQRTQRNFALKSYLNELRAKQEEQQRQQQEETTRFWRESNAYYNSPAGDQY